MLHELLPLLPDRLTAAPTGVLAGAAAGGLLLGWFGARFSRALFALAAVAAGAFAGMRLAIALGAVLALWALAGTWIAAGNGAKWDPTGLHWSGDTVLFLQQLWHTLPGDLSRLVPAFCAGALSAGLLTGILWPRLSRCLLYSVAGLTVVLPTGLVLITRLRPDWLAQLPETSALQVALLVAWTAVTFVVQWRLSPEPPKRFASAKPPHPEQRLTAKQAAPRAEDRSIGRKNRVVRSGPVRPALFIPPAGPAVGRT
jgi:hypothetical protein